MKGRFTSLDIFASIKELNEIIIGFRLVNVYDVDSKTYLFKLAKTNEDKKAMLLIESGIRIHATEFEWPKNPAPSGFSMKMRKHLKNKRVEAISQLGSDRIVDLQFGTGEVAFHVIVELYDRGNLFLTDHEYTILHLLRPRTDTDQDVRFATRQRYPLELAKGPGMREDEAYFRELLDAAKPGDNFRKILMTHFAYGPALLEHALKEVGLHPNAKLGKDFTAEAATFTKLCAMVSCAEAVVTELREREEPVGFVTFRTEETAPVEGAEEGSFEQFLEFHPFCFNQVKDRTFHTYDTFNKAVDDFFSKMESQKMEVRRIQQEKSALKKLDNIRKDHDKRVADLQASQAEDRRRAEVIIANAHLVDKAIANINLALANQIDWQDIETLVREARQHGDYVASSISKLNLAQNTITMQLEDFNQESGSDEDLAEARKMLVPVDLSMTAFANAKKYFDLKRFASKKESKTLSSSKKALKSAEEKTKQMLKDVQTASSINKIRKIHWFEKFFWFISSENFLVVAGRDQQQNEMLVKRYLRTGDIYVHADLHGASSVVVKNPRPDCPVSPKSLHEAGIAAVVYSSAWTARVVCGAWWVNAEQVSKTPPTGEYLPAGSFMIRGKKNYLPPCQLTFGFGFVFRLDEDSLERHAGERKVRTAEEEKKEEEEEEEEDGDVDDEDEEEEGGDGDEENEEEEEESAEIEQRVNELKLEEVEEEEEEEDEQKEEHEDREEVKEEEQKEEEEEDGDEKRDADDEDEKEQTEGKEDEEIEFPDAKLTIDYGRLGSNQPRSISITEDGARSRIESQMSTNRRLSAKERRNLKKQKQRAASDLADESPNPEGTTQKPPKPEKTEKAAAEPERPKRGQRAKQKRIRAKYADQDEEERALRMALLQGGEGSGGKRQRKKEAEERKAREAEERRRRAEERKKEQMRKAREKQQRKDAGDEEDDEDNPMPLTDDSSVLSSLTGIPVAEDTLLYGVPVCAPWPTLLSYKFKAKLLPGNTKRGKATKSALQAFVNDRGTTPREKELLRVQKDQDLSRNLPGKVKLSLVHFNKKR